MEGTRRALLRLIAACCLLCVLPGEGQKTADALVIPSPSSSVLLSHQPREDSVFSSVTTANPETSLEKNFTAAAFNATGAHDTEMEDASIPTTPMVGTKVERLQAATTVSPGGITFEQHEHHTTSFSVNSSTEIPSPPLTASTLEENQTNHEVTEPFSTTDDMDDASSATTTPLNSVPATTNSSQLGSSDGQTMGPTTARSETRPGTSPVSATEESTVEPRISSVPISTAGSISSATVSGTVTLVISSTTGTTAIPTSTSSLEQPVDPIHEKASVLDVGDDENPELPSSPLADTTRADPLVITVISVFIVMVGILGLVGFLRYRQHNSRMEFRRLQDLPMDDMMEDTPLSLYSY
ncbi:putative GPI-anchored protein pfl2 isoform X1 [Calypte anna]|nr:putative GPI-anchored protein pfl2 isoform X1 [Calypte anna]